MLQFPMDMKDKIKNKFPNASDRQINEIEGLLIRHLLIESAKEIDDDTADKKLNEIKHLETSDFQNFMTLYSKLFPDNAKNIDNAVDLFLSQY